MNRAGHQPIPFPPIHRHGLIDDRRTGALVAADGTLNWFCASNFDSPPLFGALLDPDNGGFCRFGPARASLGRQHYLRETAAVVTSWSDGAQDGSGLQSTDLMAWPADARSRTARDQRVIVRRLHARDDAAVLLIPLMEFLPADHPRVEQAESILERCEAMAGELGLFAEEADARRRTFLGNTPLLFAHVEYVRAAREVAKARDATGGSGKENMHEQ